MVRQLPLLRAGSPGEKPRLPVVAWSWRPGFARERYGYTDFATKTTVVAPEIVTARMPKSDSEEAAGSGDSAAANPSAIICPVCGEPTVQEKCKVICKSDVCRWRVIMNCAEF
jgi:hypothetical protein